MISEFHTEVLIMLSLTTSPPHPRTTRVSRYFYDDVTHTEGLSTTKNRPEGYDDAPALVVNAENNPAS